MWLCTKLGFYSIVEKLPGEIHVRARYRHDLVNLKRACAKKLGGKRTRWKIHRTEPADYRYRIVIGPAALRGIMLTLSANLDYSNFKGVISRTEDQAEKLTVYSHFHHGMEGLQRIDQYFSGLPPEEDQEPRAIADASISSPIPRY